MVYLSPYLSLGPQGAGEGTIAGFNTSSWEREVLGVLNRAASVLVHNDYNPTWKSGKDMKAEGRNDDDLWLSGSSLRVQCSPQPRGAAGIWAQGRLCKPGNFLSVEHPFWLQMRKTRAQPF